MENFKIRRFEEGAPLWFFFCCLFNGNFKSVKRLIIYYFHFSCIIDLRDSKKSKDYTNYELLNAFERKYTIRIKKSDIREATNIKSNVTFNKKFKEHFVQNNLVGRKTFNPTEVYKMLEFWQGEGEWFRNEAFSKNELKNIFTEGDYKQLANEFEIFFENYDYKNHDKISPKILKLFIQHIDFNDREIIEEQFMI